MNGPGRTNGDGRSNKGVEPSSVTGDYPLPTKNLTRLALVHEDKLAVVMAPSGCTLTYRQLEDRSNALAHYFRAAGLRPGDHIAILMRNDVDLFPVVWAAQRAGLIYTPVNWHLEDDEAAYVIENCGAVMLVHCPESTSLAEYATLRAPRLQDRLVTGPGNSLDVATETMPIAPIPDETEGHYMFYSSGTTGRPKGILPKRVDTAFGTGLPIDSTMASAFGFSSSSVYLSTGPLYHAAPLGWCLGTVRNGGTTVVMEKFDAEASLELIQQYRVTHAQFVPTMFVRMLKLDDAIRARHDVSSIELVVHAAAPCPIEVKERMIEWFGEKLTEYYSGSEGTGFFMIDSADWLEHKGSVGQAVLGKVHICDDDGIELPTGEVGTVWFSEIARFEYLGDPAKTADAFNAKGWNTLGDLGHVDDDGFLYLSARRSDLILSGGVNIYPQEVEDALALHPAVADVAVIGVDDEEMGQRVHAVITPAPGVTADDELAADIMTYCRDRIAGYKRPRSVTFGHVPRLPTGKLLRRALMTPSDTAPDGRTTGV